MKRLLSAAFSLLLLAGCTSATPGDTASDGGSQTPPAAMEKKETTVRWKFESQGEPKDGEAPRVRAWIMVSGVVEKVLDLGMYNGTEFKVPGNTSDLQITFITTASIWFAGGGDDLMVWRTTTGDVVVSHRTVDEEAGFGDPKEIARVTGISPAVEVKVML